MAISVIIASTIAVGCSIGVFLGIAAYIAYNRYFSRESSSVGDQSDTETCCNGHPRDNIFTRALDDCISFIDERFCVLCCYVCSIRGVLEQQASAFNKPQPAINQKPSLTIKMMDREYEFNTHPESPTLRIWIDSGVSPKVQTQKTFSERTISRESSVSSFEGIHVQMEEVNHNPMLSEHQSPVRYVTGIALNVAPLHLGDSMNHSPTNLFSVYEDSHDSPTRGSFYLDSPIHADSPRAHSFHEKRGFDSEAVHTASTPKSGRPPRRKGVSDMITMTRAQAAARASNGILPRTLSRCSSFSQSSTGNSSENGDHFSNRSSRASSISLENQCESGSSAEDLKKEAIDELMTEPIE